MRAFESNAIVRATQNKKTTLEEEQEEPTDLSTTCAALHPTTEKRETPAPDSRLRPAGFLRYCRKPADGMKKKNKAIGKERGGGRGGSRWRN